MKTALTRQALPRALALAIATSSAALAESEQVAEGGRLYAETCAVCHGAEGRGGPGYPNPIWGDGAQIRKFAHAQGLFEYNQMLMPFDDPTKLDNAQKWAVVAYMLANHGVIEREDGVDPAQARDVTIP
ncbi:MAG: cytochrome c [Microvirga sp.]|nr:cytochrome c [Microvirga sp.]